MQSLIEPEVSEETSAPTLAVAPAPAPAPVGVLGQALTDASTPTGSSREGATVLRGPEPVGKIGHAQITAQAPKAGTTGRTWIYAEFQNSNGRYSRIPFAAIPALISLMTLDELASLGLRAIEPDDHGGLLDHDASDDDA
jgi:hypothetical protein